MYLILSPSDIYFLTGIRPHDPGEIMILHGGEKPLVLCDARTSGLFDSEKFQIVVRENWKSIFEKYSSLETDPSHLTMTLKEQLEKYGTRYIMVPSLITRQRILKSREERDKL